MSYGHGYGFGLYLPQGGAAWTPGELDDLELWLRPEELDNPNRLIQTESLNDVAWNKVSVTVTEGQTDPNGGTAAALLTPDTTNFARWYQSAIGFQASSDDTVSFYWKRGPGHNGTSKSLIRHYDGVDFVTLATVVPPADWTRVDYTETLGAGATESSLYVYPDNDTAASDPQSILVAFPQLEAGDTVTPYVANVATAGGIVASWEDQSDNGNDATQGTQASMPLVEAGVLDGYSGALFDGIDDYLDSASATTTQPAEAWIVQVGGAAAVGGGYFLDGIVNGGARNSIRWYNAVGGYYQSYAGANLISSTGLTETALVRALFNGALSVIDVNGTQVAAATSGTQDASDGHRIGHKFDAGGQPYPGHIFEVVIVDAALSYDDRRDLLSYFNTKYPSLSITVPPALTPVDDMEGLLMNLPSDPLGSDTDPITTYGIFTSPGGADRPVIDDNAGRNLDGYASLWFDGAGDYMAMDTQGFPSGIEVFAVVNHTNEDSGGTIFDWQSNADTTRTSWTDGDTYDGCGQTVRPAQWTPSTSQEVPHVLNVSCDAAKYTYYLNRDVQNTVTGHTYASPELLEAIYMGRVHGTGTSQWKNFRIWHCIVFNRRLSDAERTNVWNWLKDLYPSLPI